MIIRFEKTYVKLIVAALAALVLLTGCSSISKPSSTVGLTANSTNHAAAAITEEKADVAANLPAQPTGDGSQASAVSPQEPENSQETPGTIIYKNTEYGFNFTLPESWKGYKIITGEWEGEPIEESTADSGTITGPMISIRHPLWTSQNPRQDIPIMIFTAEQWKSLQKGEFHIGAAPIDPSELGHNSKYVFALPARYNYAFPAGYEEVEDILKGNPLKPTDI